MSPEGQERDQASPGHLLQEGALAHFWNQQATQMASASQENPVFGLTGQAPHRAVSLVPLL